MKVLITSGPVYGRLDDNKLVSNRIRGIWAGKFAVWLANLGHDVILLQSDLTLQFQMDELAKQLRTDAKTIKTEVHNGYDSYAEQCYAWASQVDAAVMAAAVVNWIPKQAFKGKMPTEGYREGDEQHISFVLAPRVIDRMKKINPKLKLVGCKMTSGATPDQTYSAAYQTLLKAHCNVVIGNDLSNLKAKFLVYPDGSKVEVTDFKQMYTDLERLFNDEFYTTKAEEAVPDANFKDLDLACARFDSLCDKYRERFKKRPEGPHGPDRVFGGLAVHIDDHHTLVSPREKGLMFDSKTAVVVTHSNSTERTISTVRGRKASLNATLLVRFLRRHFAQGVVHLHEENPYWPTQEYAPPGTVRDNERDVTPPAFNVKGHGCFFTETP